MLHQRLATLDGNQSGSSATGKTENVWVPGRRSLTLPTVSLISFKLASSFGCFSEGCVCPPDKLTVGVRCRVHTKVEGKKWVHLKSASGLFAVLPSNPSFFHLSHHICWHGEEGIEAIFFYLSIYLSRLPPVDPIVLYRRKPPLSAPHLAWVVDSRGRPLEKCFELNGKYNSSVSPEDWGTRRRILQSWITTSKFMHHSESSWWRNGSI